MPEPGVVRRLFDAPDHHYTPVGGNVLWQIGLLEPWPREHGIGG